MITYALFEIATGRIEHVGASSTLADVVAEGRRPGHDIVLIGDASCAPSTHYVRDDALAPRPACPGFDRVQIRADDIEAARLDLGQPFSALIDGVAHEVEDGVLEITSAMPATYMVEVRAWPYQDYDVEIVACA